jgi:UPF0271 protein
LRKCIDINCDLGESYGAFTVGNDEKIMPHITSANIACGFHAGDPETMAKTVDLAKKYGVAVGAHPGYPDLLGFGRREMRLTEEEVRNYALYQISALQGFAQSAHLKLQHVKPHGALYNTATKDETTSKAIAEAAKTVSRNMIIFAPPKSALAKAAAAAGLHVALEFFADRNYDVNGNLVSRRQKEAIIHERRRIVKRVVEAVKKGTVLDIDGHALRLGVVHTVCVHGDTPDAPRMVENLRKSLTEEGIEVRPIGKFI